MRNPIRLKNLSLRFLPLYVAGVVALLFWPPRSAGFVWAVPLAALGLALRSWGAGHLVKTDALTMTGPYAHLRHPLYAGTLLIGTGLALLFGGLLSALLIAVLWPWFALKYFPRKDRVESQRLAERYGAAFEAYRSAVPALWPRFTAYVPSTDALTRSDGKGSTSHGWSLARYSENNELGTLLAVLAGLGAFWWRAASAGS